MSSPPSDPNAISTDTDPEGTVDEEAEGDTEAAETGSGTNTAAGQTTDNSGPKRISTPMLAAEVEGVDTGELNLEEVDWQDVNDEVELAMMESDSDGDEGDEPDLDDDDEDGPSSLRSSPVASEDEGFASDRASSVNGCASLVFLN